MSSSDALWMMLLIGYPLSVLLETPILLLGLSRRHSWSRRLFAGIWLTACTYPVVILVLPQMFDMVEQRGWYLLVAETFAPVAECILFWIAFRDKESDRFASLIRDFGAIVLANLFSFAVGEWFYQTDLFALWHNDDSVRLLQNFLFTLLRA